MATLASVISMEMYSGRDPFTRQEEWHCQKVWVLVIQSVQECHTWAKGQWQEVYRGSNSHCAK